MASMNLSPLVAYALAVLSLSCPLVAQARIASPAPRVPEEIHQLFLDDQSDRSENGSAPAYAPDVESRDTLRRAQVKLLLGAGKIQSARDFHDAAYVYQHGQQPADYLLAHILAVEAVVKGDATSRWISAATLDRYLQAIGQKQVFGTQYITSPIPSGASEQPAQALKRMNGTQEPYDQTVIPDPLRLDFCVPPQEQQRANLEEFKAGRYPKGILPLGCTR